MMAYPILQIVPSAQQKRQIAFRQAALAKGINIQIRQPELPAVLADQYPDIRHCAAYFKPAKSVLEKNYIALRSNTDKQWFWLNDQRPPAALMPKMLAMYAEVPEFCLALEQNAAGSTLFLLDSLELEKTALLDETLNKLNTLISQ
jgi:hypothetical protein